MVLRLVLVGLVAGLALSMPSRRDLDTMARTAQHWANDRLAEWDTETLADSGAYVFAVDPAEAALSVVAPARPLVSDEEFAVALNDSVALFAQDALAGETRETDQSIKSGAQLAALDSSKSIVIDLELPTEPVAIIGDESLDHTDLTELVFEGWAEATNRNKPVELASSNLSTDLDLVFEEVIEATVIRFDRDTSALVATARASSDEPLEMSEDLGTDETYALNRIADRVQESTAAAAAEVDRSENQLTNAVRLTREAVVAWASLIHGPAVVTISR